MCLKWNIFIRLYLCVSHFHFQWQCENGMTPRQKKSVALAQSTNQKKTNGEYRMAAKRQQHWWNAMETNTNNCDKSHTSNDLKGLYVNPGLIYVCCCVALRCECKIKTTKRPRKCTRRVKCQVFVFFSVYNVLVCGVWTSLRMAREEKAAWNGMAVTLWALLGVWI